MIRRGKLQGWLRFDHSALWPIAQELGVEFGGVEVNRVDGKGLAVVATSTPEDVLMRVPRESVLSKETVHLHAKSDVRLRSILDSLGDFGRTARGSILVFLLYAATMCYLDFEKSSRQLSPLALYVKFLPMELLPTFWNDAEIELCNGTSLKPAVRAKLKSLDREFDLLYSKTKDIPWCEEYWWDKLGGLIALDDWKQVDAFYRSRALEFPGIGDCMVPCIDMCNHESGPNTRALYESDNQGNAILIAHDGFLPNASDEVTITYGDDKGACEMIFSYGFLEASMESAKSIFVDLDIPESDPMKSAKRSIQISAPGVRLTEDQLENLEWTSDYVWLVCVNEEDGLGIEIAQTINGDTELQATWKGSNLTKMSMIEESLRLDPLWKVFELRAIVTLQNRIETQLKAIYDDEDDFEQRCNNEGLREQPKTLALRLRQLETDLLGKFYEHFENEKLKLVDFVEVREYLAGRASVEVYSEQSNEQPANHNGDDDVDDFS